MTRFRFRFSVILVATVLTVSASARAQQDPFWPFAPDAKVVVFDTTLILRCDVPQADAENFESQILKVIGAAGMVDPGSPANQPRLSRRQEFESMDHGTEVMIDPDYHSAVRADQTVMSGTLSDFLRHVDEERKKSPQYIPKQNVYVYRSPLVSASRALESELRDHLSEFSCQSASVR